MKKDSGLLSYSLGFLVPIILVFGIYMSVNGHVTPGGGFQAGAVLATVFVCKHLMQPEMNVQLKRVELVEKLTLLIILIIPQYVFMVLGQNHLLWMGKYYYMLLNFLIAVKVASGFTVLFIRFIHYEVR